MAGLIRFHDIKFELLWKSPCTSSMHLLCIFSLFSSCFRTPDTYQPELQPTPQTSTLQAGNELGRAEGGEVGLGQTLLPLFL